MNGKWFEPQVQKLSYGPPHIGGYFDFSHLTEIKKYIHITEIYMKNNTNHQ